MEKARVGEPLAIRARDWNRLADIANRFGDQSSGGSQRIDDNYVWVKNTLGRDLDAYAAVSIGSPLLVESHTMKIDPVFGLVNGSLRGQQGYGQADPIIGILPQPIASNRFGLAQIAGLTPASFTNTEGNTNGANTNIPEYATLSDDKDALAYCEYGPVRVLQRNISGGTNSNFSSGKYLLVRLGEPTNVGSCELTFTTDWTSTPNESRTWSAATGDLMRLGVHGDGEDAFLKPTGKLYISRPGRYQVTIEWRFALVSSPGWSTGDRLEWRITWPPAVTPEWEFGGFAVHSWVGGGGAVNYIHGERSYYYALTGNDMKQEIPTPGIEARKVPSSGSATDVDVTGDGKVRVIRLGPCGQSSGGSSPWNSYWTKAKRDASWARGSTDAPI